MSDCLTSEQLKCIQTNFSAMRLGTDEKQTIINGFSEGRTTSSRELTQDEAAALIKHLKERNPAPPDKREKMRRNIIAMAHEMGWKAGKKADMARINAWCLVQFGKKELNDYSYVELPKLVYAFRKVYEHYLKNI